MPQFFGLVEAHPHRCVAPRQHAVSGVHIALRAPARTGLRQDLHGRICTVFHPSLWIQTMNRCTHLALCAPAAYRLHLRLNMA